MAVRTKVIVLLVGVFVFLAGATGVSLLVRGRAADALAGAAERDVRLLVTATHVTAAHLEQAIRLERALRHAGDRRHAADAHAAYELAKSEYETYAAEIWRRLEEARRVASVDEASRGEEVAANLALLDRIDAEHNAYADHARDAFALLDEGRVGDATERVLRISRDEDNLEQALGALLIEVSASTEDASAQARRDWALTSWLVAALIAAAFVLMFAVFLVVVRLVSEMKSLEGLLPICSHCKKIRDGQGSWNQLEAYLQANSDAAFTHGICADCQARMRAEIAARRIPAIVDGFGI